MIITTIRSRTCPLKTLSYNLLKLDQPIRYESQSTALRYPDHQMIYKFPLITVASIVNRLKFYTTAATGIGASASTILAISDIISTEMALACTGVGVVWCSGLFTIGFLGQNRIGYMYLRNDQQSVKISYSDFWGKRVDTDIDTNDICPLSDAPDSVFSFLYHHLRRYSTTKTLKFNVKYADIVDSEKFQLVFGDPVLIAKR